MGQVHFRLRSRQRPPPEAAVTIVWLRPQACISHFIMKAFECIRCGICCYGEGGIRLETHEIERIAGFLALSSEAFVKKYCQEKHGRLSLRSGKDQFCIFFDNEKQCLIHPVKPRPCSLWPFYPAVVKERENWAMAMDACPGINPRCSFEEFVRQSEE